MKVCWMLDVECSMFDVRCYEAFRLHIHSSASGFNGSVTVKRLPCPTALRIVNWLDAVHTLGDLAEPAWYERILASAWVQAEWLSHRLERHLMGTHLLKDVKALLVAGSVFGDRAAIGWRGRAEALLRRELARQIREEGSHLEPSVMYHDVALEDLASAWRDAIPSRMEGALAQA